LPFESFLITLRELNIYGISLSSLTNDFWDEHSKIWVEQNSWSKRFRSSEA
jgi:hypothetical protein